MEKTTMVFNRSVLGCWMDGEHGQEHVGAKLSDMLSDIFAITVEKVAKGRIRQIQDRLEQPPSDDFEEENTAIEIIENHTQDGLYWIQDAGDLILTDEIDD